MGVGRESVKRAGRRPRPAWVRSPSPARVLSTASAEAPPNAPPPPTPHVPSSSTFSTPSTDLTSFPPPSSPPPLSSPPLSAATPATRPPRPTAQQLTQRSLDLYLTALPPSPSISLNSQRPLGTRALLTAEDIRLYNLALSDPSHPSVSEALMSPISPSALRHLVSHGAGGWLCDLSITRVSDIANDQCSDLSFFCLDATFLSQLCQRRLTSMVLSYATVSHRFEDWLEDRHPLNRSILCIPSNTSGSHWTGIFVFLDSRVILHADSLSSSNPKHGHRALAAVRHWITCETAMQLAKPYISDAFRERLLGLQDLTAWTYGLRVEPVQTNSNDCGIFYLMNMLYTLQGRNPTFTQSHIPYFRQQLFAAILHNRMPSLHSPLSSCDAPFTIPHASLTPLLSLPTVSLSFERTSDMSMSTPPLPSPLPFSISSLPSPSLSLLLSSRPRPRRHTSPRPCEYYKYPP